MLVIAMTVFAQADGESLRNNAGEHVELGVEDGTTNIKWIKVTSDGYLITSASASASTAPTLEINNITAGVAEADYDFGGETALSFSVLNTTPSDTLYVGIATGGPYVTVYPHMSFSVPSCAIGTLWYLGTSASTDFDIVFTY
jgi:hypothetical protein